MKRHLKSVDIDTHSWERKASDRATWQKEVHDAVNTVEWKRKEKYLEGWRKRPSFPFRQLYAIIVKRWAANDEDMEYNCGNYMCMAFLSFV